MPSLRGGKERAHGGMSHELVRHFQETIPVANHQVLAAGLTDPVRLEPA